MIQTTAQGWQVTQAMTLQTASQLLSAGNAALQRGNPASPTQIDLGTVTSIDSSALAVIFAWLRSAQSRNLQLQLVQPPQELLSLAELYGVAELLPLQTVAAAAS